MVRKRAHQYFLRFAMLYVILRQNTYQDIEYEIEYHELNQPDNSIGDLLIISQTEFHRSDNLTMLLSQKEDPINDTISRILARPAIRPTIHTQSIHAFLVDVTQDKLNNKTTDETTLQSNQSAELTKQVIAIF